jgi:hypothetical protein
MCHNATVMSRNDGLFRAEVMLPAQFFPLLCGQTPRNKGECKLLAAVLEEAIDCFRKYLHASDRRQQRLFQEAEHWIMSQGDNFPFSFEHICDVLGIDPGYLRSGLLTTVERLLPNVTVSASPPMSHRADDRRSPQTYTFWHPHY